MEATGAENTAILLGACHDEITFSARLACLALSDKRFARIARNIVIDLSVLCSIKNGGVYIHQERDVAVLYPRGCRVETSPEGIVFECRGAVYRVECSGSESGPSSRAGGLGSA